MSTRSIALTPEVCVCVLSYRRLDLLRTTLRSIIQHLEDGERGLAYEVVWVDNGSDAAERHALHKEFTIEKSLFLGTNYGMAYGFNTLFFRLCAAPYFLTLEEDWEWIGSQHGAGEGILRDAISVLRHDVSLSGVFLRPDTLDQFLSRSAWRRAPSAGAAKQTAVDSAGHASTAVPSDRGIEYATYCMDRQADYLWGAYSNGPGLYDRERLQRLVGRQFGEPADAFPDMASESNFAFRVGAAGLCSAILQVWEGCAGVDACNRRLFRHIGDERSHGYGRGRQPEARWVLTGSNRSYDPAIVELRSLDVDPNAHWLSLYLSGTGRAAPSTDGGRVALLLAAPARSLAPVLGTARHALASAHAPELVEILWMLPQTRGEAAARWAAECAAADAALQRELAVRSPRPVHTRVPGGRLLRCISSEAPSRSLAERFSTLSAATEAPLLWLCPRLLASVGGTSADGMRIPPAAEPAAPAEPATPATATSPDKHRDERLAALPWDKQLRSIFVGEGDVRSHVKDHLLMVQVSPAMGGVQGDGVKGATAAAAEGAVATPAAHALVHRHALEHLGQLGPPATHSWLHWSLHLQSVFGAVGRYRRLARVTVVEYDDSDDDARDDDGGGPAAPQGGVPRTPGAGLRDTFDRATVQRAIDTHRIDHLLLALRLKSRSLYETLSAAYTHFAELYNGGHVALAWPLLAEVLWGLHTIERSDDWELRRKVSPAMREAAQDLQARLLDQFAAAANASAASPQGGSTRTPST